MAVNAGETEESQTFEEWREAVLAEYGTALNMDRDQVWKYLANRPYPRRILLTGVFVALVMVLALVQTPRYFAAKVHYEKAKTLFDAGRYEQTLDELDLAKSSGLKSRKVDFLYGKTSLTIGQVELARRLLAHMKVTDRQEAEISALLDQLKAAEPHWIAAQKHLDADDFGDEARAHLERAVAAWPTFIPSRFVLASAYGAMFTRTLDDSWLAKYQRQLADIRRMSPSAAKKMDGTFGRLENYKAANGHFVIAQQLMSGRRVDDAVCEYQAAIRTYPKHSKSHAYLAVAWARKYEATRDPKCRDECLREYKTAVDLNAKRKSVKPELGALAKEID